MSKKKTSTTGAKNKKADSPLVRIVTDPDGGEVGYFKTKHGKEIKVRPLSPYLVNKIDEGVEADWIAERGELPQAPTYSAFVGEEGDEDREEMLLYHDESSLEDDSYSDEEKKENRQKWDVYQRDLQEIRRMQTERMTKTFFLKGVDIEVPEDGWRAEQDLLGIQIPEDPLELKIHYVETELLGSVEDLTDIILAIMKLSDMTQEDIDQAVEKFQLAVE